LQKGRAGDKGIEDIEKELESISFNSDILTEKAKVNFLKTNLEKYKQTISDRSEADGKIIDFDRIIHEKLKAINSGWTRQNIIDFTNIIAHQDRIKAFKEELDNIKKEKIELKGRKDGMLASASRINPGTALIMISVVFLLASVPAFYYSLYVVAIICIAITFLIFFGRRYLIKENPVDKIDEELSEVGNKEKELQETFGNYLEKDLNLERTLSADPVLEILGTVNQLKKDIDERDDLDRKQKETRDPFIKDFENIVKSIGGLLRNIEDNSVIETLLIQITEEFDFAESQSKKQKELEDLLARKKKELEKNCNNLTGNNESVAHLLKSVNAGDRNDFRKKYEDNSKILELIEKRRTAINTIETIAGINMADDVIDFLNTHEQAGLREDIANLETNIESTNRELSSKNTELGEKKGEIKKIEGESELAGKMTELETERQKLTDAYKEWMTGKIALKILTGVREKYEKEKQPVIIKNSGRYFRKITGGRYERIHVALDKREITVFDSREASKAIDQLSRGTREQLLVSLRLGFIEEYETNAEPLPVIVDDILVNFDQKRAQKTAEIFHEFGKNRQVIIFTCHPSTKDYFGKSSVNLIELKQ
jgi:uncharacterized protein YhaN